MNDFFLDALFFVTAVYSIPFLEEEYIFIDNFRINQSYGLSLNSLIQCTAVCSRLKGKCCMLNFEREIRKCFLSSNCSELRTDLGGRTFKRKSFSVKRDCSEVPIQSGNGIYKIIPLNSGDQEIDVYCDNKLSEGGWTVIQRRINAAVSFYRPWTVYKTGFGNLNQSFWLGNDNIHAIVKQRNYRVRFDLEANSGETAYAEYETFYVDSEAKNYRLSIGGYSGTAGDAMMEGSNPSVHNSNGMAFSTPDRDNDHFTYHCAKDINKCGWWINACTKANLNGVYNSTDTSSEPPDKIYWANWKGHEGLKRVEIKIKPSMIN